MDSAVISFPLTDLAASFVSAASSDVVNSISNITEQSDDVSALVSIPLEDVDTLIQTLCDTNSYSDPLPNTNQQRFRANVLLAKRLNKDDFKLSEAQFVDLATALKSSSPQLTDIGIYEWAASNSGVFVGETGRGRFFDMWHAPYPNAKGVTVGSWFTRDILDETKRLASEGVEPGHASFPLHFDGYAISRLNEFIAYGALGQSATLKAAKAEKGA